MKKKILFIVTSLRTGGIVRSLQNYLNCYDTSLYDVHVFAMVHQGVFQGNLKNCTVLPKNLLVDASVDHFENRRGVAKIESFILKVLDKITHYRLQRNIFKQAGKKLLRSHRYDAVVGYSEGLPSQMVSLMNHPNKIGWIHCDYASYLQVDSGKTELDTYNALKSIVCVSDYTRQSFVKIFPTLKDRTYAIYNIIDDVMMKQKALEPIEESFDSTHFNIVSVGRLDPVKRLSIVPELARKVVDAGCAIRWYVIGPKGTGNEVQRFYDNLSMYGMEQSVIPLGEKANPYPYIAKADLLVNTSVSEACPYVINEAKILGTPAVCTDFGSAKEFIENGVNGYYEPIEKISERIISLIQSAEKTGEIRKNLKSFQYDNGRILSQIDGLINN